MVNIMDTEASIVSGRHVLGVQGQITMLAGNISDTMLRLYCDMPQYSLLPILARPYLAFVPAVSPDTNFMWLASSFEVCPLRKGDKITFVFDNGTSYSPELIVGGYKYGENKKSPVILNDIQLLHFSQNGLQKIEYYNKKLMMGFSFGFADTATHQYDTPGQGKELAQIMTERVIGTKTLLRQKLPNGSVFDFVHDLFSGYKSSGFAENNPVNNTTKTDDGLKW